MRILVVNDDGIDAPGLKLLAEKLLPYAKEMVIVAPTVEQSAVGHAVTVRRGLKLISYPDMFPGVKTYSIDGTPADCVKFARKHLKYDFDIVFSGVNNGLNLGDDIMYSGTVAGASEAGFMGVRGVAFSVDRNDFTGFIKYFGLIMDFLKKDDIFTESLTLNINIPRVAKGINITHQGHNPFNTQYVLKEDKRYYSEGDYRLADTDDDSDIISHNDGYISITPLTVDRTDYAVYQRNRQRIDFKS